MSNEEQRQQVANLLMAIWRGVPREYKSKYRRSIWQQFEDNVRSAAYTSNLGKFINSLCLKMSAEIGQNADDRAMADQVLNSGQDRALLKLLRDETTLIVLMVRIKNQEAQDIWRAEHPEENRK
jgi:hypothetical protein